MDLWTFVLEWLLLSLTAEVLLSLLFIACFFFFFLNQLLIRLVLEERLWPQYFSSVFCQTVCNCTWERISSFLIGGWRAILMPSASRFGSFMHFDSLCIPASLAQLDGNTNMQFAYIICTYSVLLYSRKTHIEPKKSEENPLLRSVKRDTGAKNYYSDRDEADFPG